VASDPTTSSSRAATVPVAAIDRTKVVATGDTVFTVRLAAGARSGAGAGVDRAGPNSAKAPAASATTPTGSTIARRDTNRRSGPCAGLEVGCMSDGSWLRLGGIGAIGQRLSAAQRLEGGDRADEFVAIGGDLRRPRRVPVALRVQQAEGIRGASANIVDEESGASRYFSGAWLTQPASEAAVSSRDARERNGMAGIRTSSRKRFVRLPALSSGDVVAAFHVRHRLFQTKSARCRAAARLHR
jgi:hypothetical protein